MGSQRILPKPAADAETPRAGFAENSRNALLATNQSFSLFRQESPRGFAFPIRLIDLHMSTSQRDCLFVVHVSRSHRESATAQQFPQHSTGDLPSAGLHHCSDRSPSRPGQILVQTARKSSRGSSLKFIRPRSARKRLSPRHGPPPLGPSRTHPPLETLT